MKCLCRLFRCKHKPVLVEIDRTLVRNVMVSASRAAAKKEIERQINNATEPYAHIGTSTLLDGPYIDPVQKPWDEIPPTSLTIFKWVN